MLVISGCIHTACSMRPYSLNWRTITWSWWKLLFLKSESGSKSSRCLDESCSPFAPWGHQTGWDVPLNHYFPEEVLSSIFIMKKQNRALGCLFWMLFFVELNQNEEKITNCTYSVVSLSLSCNKDCCYRKRKKREITNELDSIKMCFPFCIRYFCIIYPTVKANFPPHT